MNSATNKTKHSGLSTYQLLPLVIDWATKAAKRSVEAAAHFNEEPDADGGMGLWQSFQCEFPTDAGVDRDMLITAYGATFSAVVKAFAKPIVESTH